MKELKISMISDLKNVHLAYQQLHTCHIHMHSHTYSTCMHKCSHTYMCTHTHTITWVHLPSCINGGPGISWRTTSQTGHVLLKHKLRSRWYYGCLHHRNQSSCMTLVLPPERYACTNCVMCRYPSLLDRCDGAATGFGVCCVCMCVLCVCVCVCVCCVCVVCVC